MSFDFTTLVTDRTQSDVQRVRSVAAKIINGTASAAEIAEWNAANMKGAYNYTDLNRVEAAVDFLQTYLNNLQGILNAYREEQEVAADSLWENPWSVLSLLCKKNWAEADAPFDVELARYLSNVDAVTNAIAVGKKLPASMERLSHTGANEIERALIREYDAAVAYEAGKKQLIDNTRAAFFFSGEFYGGEV